MNADHKKKLLRKIPYGLYIVGVVSGSEWHAFTGSWLSQSSMNPPLISLGVRKDSRALELLKKGHVMSINFLGKHQKQVAEHFFKAPVRDGNRLGQYSFHAGATGAPLLDDAMGFLECRVKKIIDDLGDHAIVAAEVVEANLVHDDAALWVSDTPWSYGG